MNRIAVVSAVALLAVAAAGCGSSSKKSSSSSTKTTSAAPPPSTQSKAAGASLKLSADPGGALKFTTSSLKAKSGKVTITMANPSSIMHAIAVEGGGVDQKGKTVGQGGTSTITVSLKPGKYTFYCPVDGHKAAGMKGTLTVQ
jgi:plastocyanin